MDAGEVVASERKTLISAFLLFMSLCMTVESSRWPVAVRKFSSPGFCGFAWFFTSPFYVTFNYETRNCKIFHSKSRHPDSECFQALLSMSQNGQSEISLQIKVGNLQALIPFKESVEVPDQIKVDLLLVCGL